MDTDKAITNIYNMTYRLNGKVAALEESVNSNFRMLSDRIAESNTLHSVLKEEHERELHQLRSQVRRNTEFIEQAKGIVKLVVFVVSVSVILKVVLDHILSTL